MSRARSRPVPALRPPPTAGGRRGEQGLMTLEWLLVVGAVAGLAASSVLAVQTVLDDHSEVPEDPLVRLLEADIAAALVADEANTAALSPPYDDPAFKSRCETGIESAFADVVDDAIWTTPVTIPGSPPAPPVLDSAARCAVTPEANLGDR